MPMLMTPRPLVRYVVLVLGLLVAIHYVLTLSDESYSRSASLSNLLPHNPLYELSPAAGGKQSPSSNTTTSPPIDTTPTRRANAAFVILARNSDLNGILESVRAAEDRFNRKYHYPYVFLNELDFSEEFKKLVSQVASGPCQFGKIRPEDWYQPSWIDEERATKAREGMKDVIYGDSVPYRNMCRYNSGNFYRHELVLPYDYYWRLDPGIKLFCDIDYDPFLLMQDQKKVYGFTLSLYEYIETIPTLWAHTKDFIHQHPELIAKDNAMGFISDDGGETYNKCHFWSNFEIADLNFWRGEAYAKYFDFLDKSGGFYYERWGDAPVHSIGAALFAHKDQIHFFEDIGYRHEPFQHCPQGNVHTKGKCACLPSDNFDYDGYSCLRKYDALFKS